MTITTVQRKTRMTGNGSAFTHPIPFKFANNSDIAAIHIGSTGTLTSWVQGTQYSVTGAGGASGTATISTAPTDYTPATGEFVLFYDAAVFAQDSDLPVDRKSVV